MKDNPFTDGNIGSSGGNGSSPEHDSLSGARRERLLKQRITQLEEVFNNLPEAVLVIDINGRILSSNRQAQHLLKKSVVDTAPEQWPAEFGFYLDDAETLFPGTRMPVTRALNGETITSEEMVLKPDDSPPVWISMSSQPLRDSGGLVDGAVVMFRDISYRKQVERSREKHVLRAEALYRLSKNIAEVGDDANQILNIAAMHAAEMVGDACVATLVSDDKKRISFQAAYHPLPGSRAVLRELLLTQSYDVDDGLTGGVVRSGEPLYIPSIAPQQLAAITVPAFAKFVQMVGIESILVVPLKGRNRVLGTLGMSRDSGRPAYTSDEQSFLEDIARRTALAVENCYLFDSLRAEISERRSAEKALQQSEERFRSIFDASALGIKVLELDGEIIQTNAALQQILEYSADELVGRHYTDFVHPDDVEPARQHLENLVCGEYSESSLEHRLVAKSGELRWVNSTYASVKDRHDGKDIRFIVAMVDNITDSKRVATELLEMKARLLSRIEMERLSLAQELHDGPLQDLHSVLYQFSGLREKLEPEQRSELESAQTAIQQVIQDLRATAKELRPPTIMDFGLERAIRSHAEEFREKYPNLSIHLTLTSDRQLLAEGMRLALFRIYQQALMNVIRHANANNVKVRFIMDAEEVTLEIEDDGQGFTVPNRWVMLTRQGHFGLAGAAERIETLGGYFRVFSEPGKGTRLVARIPIYGSQWEDS